MLAAGGSEGYFMSESEWKAQVEMGAEVCKGRVPSVAGIFDLSAREAAKKARFCEEVGIDFVQVAPPHYMVPTDREVVYHYSYINDAADVGIMIYSTPWAMPNPGWEFKPGILEKLAALENVEGIKWASFDMGNSITVMRLFADELNFTINNLRNSMSLAIKLGGKGFINSDGLFAPRLVLHQWKLWQEKRYEEFDEFMLKYYIDPFLKLGQPEDITWKSMGEGPAVRLKTEGLGIDLGPSYPAQLPVSEDSVRQQLEAVRRSGIKDWVDWREEFGEEAAD